MDIFCVYAIIIVMIIIVMIIIISSTRNYIKYNFDVNSENLNSTMHSPIAEYYSSISNEKRKYVNALIRQMYRWYIAATQDQNAIIKILHANYAVGYYDALHNIASEEEINKITGLNMQKVGEAVIKQQDDSIIMIAKQCPNVIPKDEIYKEYVKKFLPNVSS